jgi:hypothetical protein
MSLLSKLATAALITATFSSFGGLAGAAPLSSSLALRDAVIPTLQSVQYYGYGYGYGYDNDCCCPPYYGSSYSSTYYGNYGNYGNYGGYGGYGGYRYAPDYHRYGYAPYRRYGYAPRAYGNYWRGY